ncbi:MAG TPA: hypothetical protein VF260_12135 [Bacilli bacterium]
MVTFIVVCAAMLAIDFLVFWGLLHMSKKDSMNYDKKFIWVDHKTQL